MVIGDGGDDDDDDDVDYDDDYDDDDEDDDGAGCAYLSCQWSFARPTLQKFSATHKIIGAHEHSLEVFIDQWEVIGNPQTTVILR